MTQYAIQSPYNIAPFPAAVLEIAHAPSLDLVFEVLRWRAGLADYLSDIWDVIDELGQPLATGSKRRPLNSQSVHDRSASETLGTGHR